ncbi:uncharacterized protein [Typha angustifolia]|uniref:uncharacterized protein n=1 Tax=Typha angustifolia TaxID=59011 RepID=UPI003C304D0C
MLEKIGLPPKPSMRGGNWVVDASHCQGCSSQFTFINRKHHCRRCGGLFCNTCTQQRMTLRGQGDSAVRICDPCKKIEEAARFELRYGHKSRATKVNPRIASKQEEDILDQILGADGKQPLTGKESPGSAVLDLYNFGSAASSSNLEGSTTLGTEGDISRTISLEMHKSTVNDIGSSNPEELREQAVEEKRRYKILKAEGKSEEALQAFKRGKELERQAGALEIALRKSRRMASRASNLSATIGAQKIDECEEPSNKKKLPVKKVKEEKADLTSELRELGWSDVDIHDADLKPSKLSLEGELSNLLGESTQKSSQGRKTGVIDNSQVIAHKKKALLLKREGKLTEAKEELKRAKILEKQLEEQDILGEAEDSDDELSALIRSMDNDKQDDLLLDERHKAGVDFDPILFVPDDHNIDGNFEVTDDDMNDPELAAALKSFGWTEEDDEQPERHAMPCPPLDETAVQNQVLALKKEALIQKRAGNVSEAMSLLKKAKLLEREVESRQSDAKIFRPELKPQNPPLEVSADSVGQRTDEGIAAEMKKSYVKSPPKSKLMIQRELLALKKKALTLRREGRLDEAEEELKKGKLLEEQLEELENAPKRAVAKGGRKNVESSPEYEEDFGTLELREEGSEADVTDQDMQDPALLSVLKNLGWNDDDVASVSKTDETSKQSNRQPTHENPVSVVPWKVAKSKGEVQKELLALKRKALALRRQGKSEEAEEELEKAKALEKQMADMEILTNANPMEDLHGFGLPQKNSDNQKSAIRVQDSDSVHLPPIVNKTQEASPLDVDASKMITSTTNAPTVSSGSVPEVSQVGFHTSGKPGLIAEESYREHFSILPQSSQSSDLFGYSAASAGKRKSSAEEFAHIENQPGVQTNIRESSSNEIDVFLRVAPDSQIMQQKEIIVATTETTVGDEEKLAHGNSTLKDEILSHKRKAVALKREGKLAEAREELKQAKLLEKRLEDGQQTSVSSRDASASPSGSTNIMQQSKSNQSQKPQKPLSGRERFKIQQESLSHKRNALKLRREGKIAEAEAEFELAKALEDQLEESDTTQGSASNMSVGKSEAVDDGLVEDLLDPQLMSALKSIGWQDSDLNAQPPRKAEPKQKINESGNPHVEKMNLEEQIKAEKLRALNLRKGGKQAEALEALRAAKRLEKKLVSLN